MIFAYELMIMRVFEGCKLMDDFVTRLRVYTNKEVSRDAGMLNLCGKLCVL